MGHSSEEMTARYSWVDGSEKREAILKVQVRLNPAAYP